MAQTSPYIRWFDDLDREDVAIVGGKNAALGEMIQRLKAEGICVPDGFATTAEAYWAYVQANDLQEKIREHLQRLERDEAALPEVGQAIRELFLHGEIPEEVAGAIREAYHALGDRYDRREVDVAARSSATAEDLPEASFAGQLESYLNVHGEKSVLDAVRRCMASLFTNRAISYREQQGFDHLEIALSVGIQKMVRADRAGAGVMFTLDTETGFPDVVVINAAWGLGESVVQGKVNPDEYQVFKRVLDEERYRPIIAKTLGVKETKIVYAEQDGPTQEVETSPEEQAQFTLRDDEVLVLARWAAAIERHYEHPMDIEWAKDGETDELYIVQARPETVHSAKTAAKLTTYTLQERGEVLLEGLAIGKAIAAGEAMVIPDLHKAEAFEQGQILVTGMTNPDWVPLMKRAAGIITDHGGRTSHAAIVSRELGVPAVIGTGRATEVLKSGQAVTVSCVEGDTGYVYEGELPYESTEIDPGEVPQTRTKVMINVASPDGAFRWWRLPVDGVGLGRLEFIINNAIGIHPLALTRFDQLQDDEVRQEIARRTEGYADRTEYFVERLARALGKIATAQYPRPVIIRLSDFKTNEYAQLLGGRQFEPDEANPMLGFRGASRYYSDRYRDGFALECRAFRMAREELGLTNIIAMIPFCRTPEEADRVLAVMVEEGLRRGEGDFQVYMMAEIPSNVILAEEFGQRIDGFSIGSNDLTQFVLGIDRDLAELAYLFDERHPAVTTFICDLITRAHAVETPVSFCGQAPSDHPEYAAFLVEAGIDSISVDPDSVIAVRQQVADVEKGHTS
ncbi:MAG: phosphoenolpyruvate synthase [Armatimonadota bacterium]